MPIPVYSPGQVLGAADCNNWFTPKAAYKTADLARASTTTLANDPDLVLPLAVSAFYAFTCFLLCEGSNTASQALKWAFSIPGGTNVRYHAVFTDASGGQTTGPAFTGAFVNTCGTNGAGNLRGVTMTGSVFSGSTAGSMQFQWAQNVSEASTVTLHAQSYLILHRMG